MPSAHIPCGREELTLELPAGAALLQSCEMPPLADPAGAVADALAHPLGGPPLAKLAQGKASACVVVSDITRPVPNRLLLPPLLDTLLGAGIPRDGVTILIATGMHRPATGPELEELLGPEVTGSWRVANHDCQDAASLEVVDTIQGAPIAVNRRYLETQLKIVTGLIEPHPFAGFSGGGKSILPGVASLEAMKFMHSFQMIAHPGVRAGSLEGNPFQEQVGRVARAAGLDFMLNVVIDRRRPLGVFAGAFPQAFAPGCALAARQTVIPVAEPFDLVITSGGGHPLDATLYQASKGLLAAKAITRPGGTVLWITQCAQGLGSEEYCGMVRRCATPQGFRAIHGDPANFVVDQWGAQAYFQCLEHLGRVLVYAPGLEAAEARAFGLEWVEDLPATLRELCAGHARVAVMPEGPYLSPLLHGGPPEPGRKSGSAAHE